MIGSHFYYNVRVFSKARLVSKDSGVYLDLYFPNNGTNVQTGKGSGYIIPFVTQRSLLKNFSLCDKSGLDTDTALVEINL